MHCLDGGGVSITTESAEFKATKKDAEDSCSIASAGGSSTTCEAVKK